MQIQLKEKRIHGQTPRQRKRLTSSFDSPYICAIEILLIFSYVWCIPSDYTILTY